jgi:hypothetical protein
MAENINAFQAEIKELEAKLEAKKKEMAASGTESPEQHVFKAVIREHAGAETPTVNFSAAATQAAQTGTPSTPASPADEQKIDDLVTHAFTKGIPAAVSEARKLNIPYLVDMLHDRLADEYYQKLLEARKLNTE